MKRRVLYSLFAGVALFLVPLFSAQAANFTSPNFEINGTIGDSIAGQQSSANYQMTAVGGESIAGNLTSDSYKLAEGYTPTLQNSIELNVQADGLVAYYPFDTNSGNSVYDATSQRNNALLSDNMSWVSGKVGNAINFDGTTGPTNNIEAPLESELTSAEFTVSAWINVDSLANDVTPEAAIISRQASSSSDRHFSLHVNRSTQKVEGSSAFNGTAQTLASDTTVEDSTWHHVAFTVDGGVQKIYVDGNLENSVTRSGTISTDAAQLVIGKSGGFEGSYDEAKVFNRPLSDEEVSAEYDAGESGNPSGLSLDELTPGVPVNRSADVTARTDAPGYNILASQDNDLTSQSSSETIPAVSSTIASPLDWTDGVTKGLGFTMVSTNASTIDGKWNSGNAYAALPSNATSFYARSGSTAGATDVHKLRLRLDVDTSQEAGRYSNQMIITGTLTP